MRYEICIYECLCYYNEWMNMLKGLKNVNIVFRWVILIFKSLFFTVILLLKIFWIKCRVIVIKYNLIKILWEEDEEKRSCIGFSFIKLMQSANNVVVYFRQGLDVF